MSICNNTTLQSRTNFVLVSGLISVSVKFRYNASLNDTSPEKVDTGT